MTRSTSIKLLAAAGLVLVSGTALAQSLHVSPSGNVGVGTLTPSTALHVRRSDGTAYGLIEDASAGAAARTQLELRNNGTSRFKFVDTSAGGFDEWFFAGSQQDFRISFIGTPVEMRVNPGGNMFITGSLTQNSDRNAKQGITPVDPDEVLERLDQVPVSRWRYKDTPGVEHIGPMAQDFHAAFGVGASETGLSSIDTGGVAIAAIQALKRDNDSLRAQNLSLEQRVHELETLLTALAQKMATEDQVARSR